jgi:fumarylpyruvate hydrolase
MTMSLKWAAFPGATRRFSSRSLRMPCCWMKISPIHRQATMCIMKWNWLYLALHSGGAVTEASQHIYGYAVGIDMTRRDLQGAAKKAGKPWEIAKAFEHSAPISEVTPKADIGLLERASISLHVNEEQRQNSDISEMIWTVPEIISELSKLFELHAGDMIFTGTPSGVGPVQPGDRLRAAIERVGELTLQVCKPS